MIALIDYLEGQVHIAPLPSMYTPTSAPTQAPAGSNNIDNKGGAAATTLPMGMIVAITLGGLFFTLVGSLFIYFCYYRALPPPPLLEKKKKKEEEDSPYTVHSYVGYSEMDDTPLPPPPQPTGYYFYPAPQPMPAGYYGPPHMLNMKDKDGKGGKDKDIHAADEGFLRRLFPYKVHSFRGYQEGMEEVDEDDEPSAMKRKMQQMNKKTSDTIDEATEDEAEEEEGAFVGNDGRIRDEDGAHLGPAGSRESVTVEYKHLKPVASTASIDGTGNPIVNGNGNRVSVNASVIADVDLTALRQDLKSHSKKASNYVQSMYYENKKADFSYDSPVRANKPTNLFEEHPVDAAEQERVEIKKRLMSKVSSGLSNVAPQIQEEYRDDDSVSNASGSQVSKESGQSSGHSSNSSNSQVDAAKAKYAKYLAAVKNNPELAKQLTSSSTRANSVTENKKENTVRAVETSATTTTTTTTTAKVTSAKNVRVTSGAPVTIPNADHEPIVTKRFSPLKKLQSASMEIDVAMTEPMKFMTLAEIPEEEQGNTGGDHLSVTSNGRSAANSSSDPEAREDLIRNEEIERLKSVDHVRKLVYEEAQTHQSNTVTMASSTMTTSSSSSSATSAVVHTTTQQQDEETRLQEEARLRTEEKARARFALFKTKAEQLDKQSKQ
jgi:hypothetical protein